MSWSAYFYARADGHLVEVGDWNFTHNTNGMIAKVLDTVGQPPDNHFLVGRTWWDALNGTSGEDGAQFLDVIVNGLCEAPALFRSMNPDNGWGDYDSLGSWRVPGRRTRCSRVPSVGRATVPDSCGIGSVPSRQGS